jgi:hypothetical protein
MTMLNDLDKQYLKRNQRLIDRLHTLRLIRDSRQSLENLTDHLEKQLGKPVWVLERALSFLVKAEAAMQRLCDETRL